MKFMGSKSRIAKYIVPIIQKEINDNHVTTYIEPCVGGANVIDKIICKHKIGYDKDKYLIALHQHVQDGLSLYDEVPKDLYDKARKAWYKDNADNEFEDWQIGCICYLASVNGRDFSAGYAKDGYEHRKDGTLKERHYYQEAKRNLLTQAFNEQYYNIDFRVGNLFTLDNISNALIYVDPPYANVKQYANAKRFDYEKFWNLIRNWSQDNIVLISELEAPEDFEAVWKQEVSRSIKAQDKSRAVEKLWRYKK